MSTNQSQKYFRSNFMRKFILRDRRGNEVLRMDSLDPQLRSLLLSITFSKPYYLRSYKHIETISHEEYGNTSMWWIIMMYNDYIHPLEIKVGSVLQIPDKSQIDRFVNRQVNNRGERVVL